MHITVKLTENIDTQKSIFRCVKVDPRTYKQTHTPLLNKGVRGRGGAWCEGTLPWVLLAIFRK